jgi:HK97 gp10 family phage protein
VIKLEIRASDFKKFEDNINGTIAKKLSEVEVAAKNTMKTMEDEAVAAAPFKTGALKNSISFSEIGKLTYELRADVPYAAYVEFGTGKYYKDYPGKSTFWRKKAREFYVDGSGKTDTQPFFYPTINKNIEKLRQTIAKILSKNA